MNNKHLSWYEEINNNFIIASRAYFLQLGGVTWTWPATWATTYPIWATQDIHGGLAGLTSRSEGVGDEDDGGDDGGAPWFLQKQKPYKLSLIHPE